MATAEDLALSILSSANATVQARLANASSSGENGKLRSFLVDKRRMRRMYYYCRRLSNVTAAGGNWSNATNATLVAARQLCGGFCSHGHWPHGHSTSLPAFSSPRLSARANFFFLTTCLYFPQHRFRRPARPLASRPLASRAQSPRAQPPRTQSSWALASWALASWPQPSQPQPALALAARALASRTSTTFTSSAHVFDPDDAALLFSFVSLSSP